MTPHFAYVLTFALVLILLVAPSHPASGGEKGEQSSRQVVYVSFDSISATRLKNFAPELYAKLKKDGCCGLSPLENFFLQLPGEGDPVSAAARPVQYEIGVAKRTNLSRTNLSRGDDETTRFELVVKALGETVEVEIKKESREAHSIEFDRKGACIFEVRVGANTEFLIVTIR